MARKKFDRSLLPPKPDLSFEKKLWSEKINRVAGIDEAGRGALAGPVFAAAVILPAGEPGLDETLSGVHDSKQLKPADRAFWRNQIIKIAVGWGVGAASSHEIDQIGILPATRLAIRRALLQLTTFPDHLLVDALTLDNVPIPQTSLIKGDARSKSIAAASILAKTARDAEMETLDSEYPGYKFSQNKGYGTQAHLDAIFNLGPCQVHRRSFSPFRPRLFP